MPPNNPYIQGSQTPTTGTTGMSQANPYIQGGVTAITGAVEMGMDIKGNIDQYRDMDVSVGGLSRDFSGKPQYDLADDIQKLEGLRTEDVGKGMIGRSVAKGLSTGFSAGAATMNPWGMAIGAAAGTIGGLFAGIFGKKKAVAEHEKKLNELNANIGRKQGNFNEANKSFYDTQDTRDIYNLQEERRQNRMYNIPSFNS